MWALGIELGLPGLGAGASPQGPISRALDVCDIMSLHRNRICRYWNGVDIDIGGKQIWKPDVSVELESLLL